MMNSHGGHWTNATATGWRTPVADQVVLGHLLPHYQAAREWQDTVRAQRIVEGGLADGKPSRVQSLVSLLHDAIRRWRSRTWPLPVDRYLTTVESSPGGTPVL
jgi:hypothetical protein